MHPRVSELCETIKAKKHDIRSLANFISTSFPTIDVFDWEELKTLIVQTYELSDADVDDFLRPPEFTKDGGYHDDFTPMLRERGFSGFLRRYVDHLVHTETPAAFHFASGLAILAASLQRQVWLDQQLYKIYPAIQILLLGPSGRTHKTTGAEHAIQHGEQAQRFIRLADEITPPQLRRTLSDITAKTGQACALLYSSELSTLLGRQEYNEGLIQTLTDIYDARLKYEKDTKTAGKDTIKEMALTFLGCSNEGWASYSLPQSSVTGGYVGRHLTFYQSGTNKRVPFPTFADPEECGRLTSMLQLTAAVRGEFVLTPAARAWFIAKYDRICDNRPEDSDIDPFWARYGDHLMRLALLIRVSDIIAECYDKQGTISTIYHGIDVIDFERADALIKWLMRYLPRVHNFLGTSKFGSEYQRIILWIARNGGKVTDNQLGRAMSKYMSRKQLDEYVDSLVRNMTLKRRMLPPPHVDGASELTLTRKVEEL